MGGDLFFPQIYANGVTLRTCFHSPINLLDRCRNDHLSKKDPSACHASLWISSFFRRTILWPPTKINDA